MIRHIITLLWNRKRSLVWIFVEQMLVFGVMLLVFISQSVELRYYFSKGNISMDNVALIGFYEIDRPREMPNEENNALFRNMLERMKEWQSVELISINRNAAFNTNQRRDSVSFNEQRVIADIKYCDENYYWMFSPKLSEGQWYSDLDVSEIPPVVITQLLANNLGITGSAIGKNIYYNGRNFRVIGVVEAFKGGVTSNQMAVLFIPTSVEVDWHWEYGVKFKQGHGRDFAKAFIVEFNRNFSSDLFQPVLMDMGRTMYQMNFFNFKFQIYLFGTPTAFLLIFAFLGTFGLVWVQSKKRMSEFGLRMALGCTPARLQRTIILENLILTTFAMLPGLIIVANLFVFAPRSDGAWVWFVAAVGAAVVLMWLFAAVSAWYPAWRASRVQPMEALKSSG